MTSSPGGPVAPRDAATVMVVRPGSGDGVEVLLLRRHARSGFAADAWVFPGGAVDPADAALPRQRWSGIEPAALAGRFDADPVLVLALHVAAVRETFEEAGVLFATTTDGRPVDLSAEGVAQARAALGDRSDPLDFGGWLADEGIVLDLGALELWGRWITPTSEPMRYDTAFFVARAPAGQVAEHDRTETTGHGWLSPREALDRAADGNLRLMYPTATTLREMAGLSSPDALRHHAATRPAVRAVLPHVETGADGHPRILHPDDPGFPASRYRDVGRRRSR